MRGEDFPRQCSRVRTEISRRNYEFMHFYGYASERGHGSAFKRALTEKGKGEARKDSELRVSARLEDKIVYTPFFLLDARKYSDVDIHRRSISEGFPRNEEGRARNERERIYRDRR